MIAHRLCLALGRWNSVEQMLDELTHDEFESWVEFYQVEPWGERRADLRAARICWAVQQPHTKRRLNEQAYLLNFGPALEVSEEEFRRKVDRRFNQIARSMN